MRNVEVAACTQGEQCLELPPVTELVVPVQLRKSERMVYQGVCSLPRSQFVPRCSDFAGAHIASTDRKQTLLQAARQGRTACACRRSTTW